MLTTIFRNVLAIIGLGGNEILLIVLVLIPVSWFVCSLIALIDALRSNFQDSSSKLMWVLVIILLPLFGSILYLCIGRQQRVA